MEGTMSDYREKVEELNRMFEDFKSEADQGEEGRGSKGHSLKARKLSNQITKELKEFRKISVEHDKNS